MKNIKTAITISKPNCNQGGRYISITVEDRSSGLRIIETRMSLEAFGDAVTGLGYTDCESTLFPNYDNIGKTRVIKHLTIQPEDSAYDDLRNEYDRTEKSEIVKAWFENTEEFHDGWEIQNDGCRSQQNGRGHQLTIRRFEDE